MRKLYLFFLVIFYSPIIVFVTMYFNLFYPKKNVRLLPVNFSRIGGIYQLFWYLKLKNSKKISKNNLDIFFVGDDYKHNSFWLKIWKRSFNFSKFSSFWKIYYLLKKKLNYKFDKSIEEYSCLQNQYLSKANQNIFNNMSKDEENKIVNSKAVNLIFSNKEKEIGNSYLNKYKTSDYKFVCFHSRDSSYLKSYMPDKDWSYHNHRDCNINNYELAIKNLSKKGITCFRTGSITKDKLKFSNSKIIDYANNNDRSDFLDIYLGAKCYMSVYSECGITVIPELFDRPVVYTNWPGLNISSFNPNSLIIFKKFYSEKKKRFLSFKEINNLENCGNSSVHNLEEKGIKLIENTPDEINDAVFENLNRLQGNWKETHEETKLQNKFWSLFQHRFIKSNTLRIGSKYLLKNPELLN